MNDQRVVVDELAERPQAVRLALLDGRIEVQPVTFGVLRSAELRIGGDRMPRSDEVVPQAGMGVRSVHLLQCRQERLERVAG